jgi:hypothetical protein
MNTPTLGNYIDDEFVKYCDKHADDSVTLDQVLQATSKIEDSMAHDVI